MTGEAISRIIDERCIERALIEVARAMDERDWDAINQILAFDAVATSAPDDSTDARRSSR